MLLYNATREKSSREFEHFGTLLGGMWDKSLLLAILSFAKLLDFQSVYSKNWLKFRYS